MNEVHERGGAFGGSLSEGALDQLVIGEDHKFVVFPAAGPQLKRSQEVNVLLAVASVDAVSERLVLARSAVVGQGEVAAHAKVAGICVKMCNSAVVVVEQTYPVEHGEEVSPPNEISSDPLWELLWRG